MSTFTIITVLLQPLLLYAHQCKGHKTCQYIPVNSSACLTGVASYCSIYDAVSSLRISAFVNSKTSMNASFLLSLSTVCLRRTVFTIET